MSKLHREWPPVPAHPTSSRFSVLRPVMPSSLTQPLLFDLLQPEEGTVLRLQEEGHFRGPRSLSQLLCP